MEVLNASKRRYISILLGTLTIVWSITPLGASAGEAFDATIKERLQKAGAISICDLDLERHVGRQIEVYGNVFATRASGLLMSDPRCPSVVVGVQRWLPYIPIDPLAGHLDARDLNLAWREPRTGTLLYCTCGGTIRRTTVPGKFYIEIDYTRQGEFIPMEDAPAYPSQIVLEDGRIVPGPEFLIPRALKRVTEKEWRAAASKPGFIPPSPW